MEFVTSTMVKITRKETWEPMEEKRIDVFGDALDFSKMSWRSLRKMVTDQKIFPEFESLMQVLSLKHFLDIGLPTFVGRPARI